MTSAVRSLVPGRRRSGGTHDRTSSGQVRSGPWRLGARHPVLLPVFYLVVTGFKTEATAVLLPPRILPFGDELPLSFTPTLENFREVFDRGFGPFVLHSVVAVGVSTAIVMALAIPCAFALVWRPGRRNHVLFFFLSTKFLPAVGVIIPIFVIAGTWV